MEIEIELTKKEKQTINIETPAYFFGNYREIKLTEIEIIEVNNNICVIQRADDPYCGFNDHIARIIKFITSSKEAYEKELQSFIKSIQK